MDWHLFSAVCIVLGTFIAILAYSELIQNGRILHASERRLAKDAHPRQAA